MKCFVTVLAALFVSATLHAQSRIYIPVVGSTPGAFGSFFRTEMQLNNRSAQPMSGTIVFHPQGRSAMPGDPSMRYSLAPHQTVHYEDVVASLGEAGLGSMDLVADGNGIPTVIARACDDKGEGGTTGATVPAILPAEALGDGKTGWLVVPRDRGRYRFNIGLRTLAEGATALVTLYGENGIQRKSFQLTLPADFFVQQTADGFAAEVLLPNESLSFHVTSGQMIVYGTTTDSLTNDPSIQVAVAGQ